MDRDKKLDSIIQEFFLKKPKINSREFGVTPPNNISSLLLFIDGTNRVYQYAQELNKYVSFLQGNINSDLNLFPNINPSWLPELPKYEELIDYIEELIPSIEIGKHSDLTRVFIYLFIYLFIGKYIKIPKSYKNLSI